MNYRKLFIEKRMMAHWKIKLHEVIFEADTKAGKTFDVMLIISIVLSILVIMIDSVKELNLEYSIQLYTLEWIFTFFFTLEYFLRIISFKKPLKYVFSFFGIIDLLSILPTYVSLFLPGSQYLVTIRFLRVLRVFRVLKLMQFVSEATILTESLRRSSRKIIVFIMTVFILVCIFGSVMYVVEDSQNGFTSIPKSIYWAIVTMTTVGYGDIAPQTNLGQTISSFIMILGYGILAVPTGIVTAEMSRNIHVNKNTQVCINCGEDEHDDSAKYCNKCGENLHP